MTGAVHEPGVEGERIRVAHERAEYDQKHHGQAEQDDRSDGVTQDAHELKSGEPERRFRKSVMVSPSTPFR